MTQLLTSLAPNSETTGKSTFLLARLTSHRCCPGQVCWDYAKGLPSSLLRHCCSGLLSQPTVFVFQSNVSIIGIPSHACEEGWGPAYVCPESQSINAASYQPTSVIVV